MHFHLDSRSDRVLSRGRRAERNLTSLERAPDVWTKAWTSMSTLSGLVKFRSNWLQWTLPNLEKRERDSGQPRQERNWSPRLFYFLLHSHSVIT